MYISVTVLSIYLKMFDVYICKCLTYISMIVLRVYIYIYIYIYLCVCVCVCVCVCKSLTYISVTV
jgi:hypothetical protein